MIERCNRPAIVYSNHNGYRLCADCLAKSKSEPDVRWLREGMGIGIQRCDRLITIHSDLLEKKDYRRPTSAK